MCSFLIDIQLDMFISDENADGYVYLWQIPVNMFISDRSEIVCNIYSNLILEPTGPYIYIIWNILFYNISS